MRLFLLALLSSILFFVSCGKDDTKIEYGEAYKYPVAAFDYTGNDGPAPVSIQFTNYSESINPDSVNYLWTFGENGPESDEKNPIHTFNNNTSNGITKQITLRVYDQVSGYSQARSIAIVIAPANK